MLLKSLTFVDSRSCLARAFRTVVCLQIIGNNVLRYLLKTNGTSSSLPMHVDFATRIAAKRSLSLLTMQLGHTDRLTLVNYTFHDTQLSLPYSVMNKFTCTRKTFLSLRSCEFVKVCTLPDIYIRLKMCAEMKEEAQVHSFRTYPGYSYSSLGISRIPTPQKNASFSILSKPKTFQLHSVHFVIVATLLSKRNHHLQTEKTVKLSDKATKMCPKYRHC